MEKYKTEVKLKVVKSFLAGEGGAIQFNYSQAAAKSNSENVLVIWDNPVVARRYVAHWESRWRQGIEVDNKY